MTDAIMQQIEAQFAHEYWTHVAEIIVRIEEGHMQEGCEGYLIVTNRQEIFVGIENYTQCCEKWGYLTSEDELWRFVGGVLTKIEIVDEALDVKDMPTLYDGSAMFVNFTTADRGLFQIVVYNDNGYYGHDVIIRSKQLTYDGKI
jgi:hypothetical protein